METSSVIITPSETEPPTTSPIETETPGSVIIVTPEKETSDNSDLQTLLETQFDTFNIYMGFDVALSISTTFILLMILFFVAIRVGGGR